MHSSGTFNDSKQNLSKFKSVRAYKSQQESSTVHENLRPNKSKNLTSCSHLVLALSNVYRLVIQPGVVGRSVSKPVSRSVGWLGW